MSDSRYLIDGITKWIHRWKQTGWTTSQGEPVANADDWRALDEAVQAIGRPLKWIHARGHVGIPGNERADEIATSFSAQRPFNLYAGPISHYVLPLEKLGDLSIQEEAMTAKKNKGSSAKPFCYASLVDGKAQRHATWAECEARVKGKSGAKYRKVLSEGDLTALCEEWGVKKPD